MKWFSNIAIAILSVLAPLSAKAVEVLDTVSVNGIRYVITDSKTLSCKVVPNKGKYQGDIVIPEKITVDGSSFTVVAVASDAFAYCENLISVSLPNSLKLIGDGAFRNCYGLTFLEIPEGVTSIGESAFINSYNLNTLVLPSTLKVVGYNAFHNYSLVKVYFRSQTIPLFKTHTPTVYNLKEASPQFYPGNGFAVSCTVFVPEGCASEYRKSQYWNKSKIVEYSSTQDINTKWTVPDSILYERREFSLIDNIADFSSNGISYNITGDSTCMVVSGSEYYHGEVNVPEKVTIEGRNYIVTAVSDKAFQNCVFLEKVSLPATISAVPSFKNSTSLRSVSIPQSVGELILSKFEGCFRLNEIIRGNNVTTVDYFADIAGTIPVSGAGIGNSPIAYDIYAGNIYYTVKGGNASVVNTDNICTIEIPESISHDGQTYRVTGINKIGDEVLTLIIPSSITAINYYLSNCFSLEQVDLDESSKLTAQAISLALNYNECLTGQDNVVYVGNIALRIADSLYPGTINIKSGTRTVAGKMCQNAAISGIILPEGLETIEGNAFYGCRNLEKLDLPESLGTLYLSSIAGCTGLKSLTIPSGCSVPDASNNNVLYELPVSEIIWKDHFIQTNESRTYFDGYLDLDYMVTDAIYNNNLSYSCYFDDKVESIPEFFSEGSRLDKMSVLNIGNSINSVGNGSFSIKTDMTDLYIAGKPVIGHYAFAGANKLENIYLNSPIPPAINGTQIPAETRKMFQAENVETLYRTYYNKFDLVTDSAAEENQAMVLGKGLDYSWKAEFTLSYNVPGTYEIYAVILPNGNVIDGNDSKPNKFTSSIKYIDGDGNPQVYKEVDSRGRNVNKTTTAKKVETILLGKVELHDNYKNGNRQEITVTLQNTGGYTISDPYSTIMLIDGLIMELVTNKPAEEIEQDRTNGVFPQSVYTNAILHVPAGSEEAYRNAPCWKLFENIVADGTNSVNSIVESQHSGNYYDMQGRFTTNPSSKGIYIKDGKKILVTE